MKRYLAGMTVLFLLGTFSWGQDNKEPFNVAKSSEELEIMKGILSTTLRFCARNAQESSSHWRFSNIDAFYLTGQGAVFIIPTSGLRFSLSNLSLGPEFNERMALLRSKLNELTRQFSSGIGAGVGPGKGGGIGSGTGSGQGGTQAFATPAPPVSPAPPVPPEIDRERLRKRIEDAQARLENLQKQTGENRQKLLQDIEGVKICLIEALANYGDSITTVKPEEYINVVLITDNFDDQKTRSDVISVRKSWITDYKAGRLNMETFKQKVVQYTE